MAVLGVAVLWIAYGVLFPDSTASPSPATASAGAPDASQETERLGPVLRGAPAGAPPATPQGTVRIAGFVRRGGRPVAARITAHRVRDGEESSQGPIAETTSDGIRGAFELQCAADPSRDAVWLLAEADGGRGVLGVLLAYASDREHVHLDLREGTARLVGQVVDGAGRPWQGRLFLRIAGEEGAPRSLGRQGPSASDGTFAFEDLPAGEVAVGADLGDGRTVLGPPVRLPSDVPYRLVADVQGEPLSIRVLRTGAPGPVVGARVTLSVRRPGPHRPAEPYDTAFGHVAWTDATGSVQMIRPREGRARVSASLPGHGGDLCEVPPDAQQVVLRVVSPGAIEGRVVAAEDGRPVAGLQVTCGHLRGGASVLSDADGRFRFPDVPPGAWSLWAAGKGFATLPTGDEERVGIPVTVEAGKVVAVDIPVAPGAVVEGRVCGPDGAPAPGAEVWLRHAHVAWKAERSGGLTAPTDAGGRFRLEGVPRRPTPLGVDLCARAPGTGVAVVDLAGTWDALAYRPPGPELLAEHVPGPVEIHLPEAGDVVLTVVDVDSGRPVPHLAVWLGKDAPEFEGVTDAEGVLVAEGLSPGPLTAGVRAKDHLTVEEKPLVAVESATLGRTTLLVKRSCEVGAAIVWADGTLADDAAFTIEVIGRNGGTHFWTDVAGTFHRQRLPWDTYDVVITEGSLEGSASAASGESPVLARATLAPGTVDAVIRLSRGPRPELRVRVLDAAGEPVPEGTLAYEYRTVEEGIAAGTWGWEGVRIQDGLALVPGHEGPIWLEVRPAAGPGPLLARTRLGPIPSGTRDLTLRIPPGLPIAGRVVGPDGAPLAGIHVEAWVETGPEPEVWSQRPFAEGKTAEDGAFRMEHLPADSYTLYARVQRGFAPAPEVVVPAGTTDVVLSLVRRVNVEVTVLLPDGSPAGNTTVTAYDPGWYGGDGAARGYCGPGGVTRLNELDPRRTYLLEVANRFPWDQQRAVRILGWRPEATTVRLPERTRLRLHVVDERGSPVSGAAVRLRSLAPSGPFPAELTYDPQGNPVALDPPPGPWIAVAWEGARVSGPQRIEAGAHEARVVLPSDGARLVIEVVGGIAPWEPPGWGNDRPVPHWILWDEGEVHLRLRGSPTPEGRVVVEGLRPDRTYACLVRDPRSEGFVALATGLVPGGETRRVERRTAPRLRVKVVEPPEAWVMQVGVLETGEAASREGAEFLLPPLPPGRYTLWASGERREDRAAVLVTVPFDGTRVPEVVLPAR